mmetsp:Transcript_139783/g.363394  ORF Transcript_139783/g.363394 Transcript_139783/m.363394 type:complete len:154 (-) Transcript_139783:727-1188(-)
MPSIGPTARTAEVIANDKPFARPRQVGGTLLFIRTKKEENAMYSLQVLTEMAAAKAANRQCPALAGKICGMKGMSMMKHPLAAKPTEKPLTRPRRFIMRGPKVSWKIKDETPAAENTLPVSAASPPKPPDSKGVIARSESHSFPVNSKTEKKQ